MSTDLMTIDACFRGPFRRDELQDRSGLFGASVNVESSDVEAWIEVFIHFSRDDGAAAAVVTPELIEQVFGWDLDMSGELPLSQLKTRNAETYQYDHLRLAGHFQTAKAVTTLAYIDARMLPDDPQDFEIASTGYGGKEEPLHRLIFAPARPATLLQSVPFDYPDVLVEHDGAVYVGCAGRYDTKVGGLFRWDGISDRREPIKLAKKAPMVHALLSDGDTLWVGAGDSLYRVEGDQVSAKWNAKTGLPGKSVMCLAKHGERIFVGCSGGYAWITDGELDAHKESLYKDTASVGQEVDGTLWIGSTAGLFRIPAGTYELEQEEGYRAARRIVATNTGVYVCLIRDTPSQPSLLMRFRDGTAEEMVDFLPTAALGGDLLVNNGGLVRADSETAERILFEKYPLKFVVQGARLWGLCKDSVVEIDPNSWSKEATVVCPTQRSAVTQGRGSYD